MDFLRTFRYKDSASSTETAVEGLIDAADTMTPGELAKALKDRDAKNPNTIGMRILMPECKGPGNAKDKYGKPWVMFLIGGSDHFRDFLCWQHIFTVDKTLTFSVMRIEPAQQSWVIVNLSGDGILCEFEDDLMRYLKKALWLDEDFRFSVDKLLTKAGVPGSVNDHVVYATNTFTLSFFDNTDCRGRPTPIAQLRGRPLTVNEKEHRDYLGVIRSMRLWFNMAQVSLTGTISCEMCKADTHPAYSCPFHLTKGWYGPDHKGMEFHAKHVEKAVAKAASSSKTTGAASSSKSGGRPGGKFSKKKA